MCSEKLAFTIEINCDSEVIGNTFVTSVDVKLQLEDVSRSSEV